MQILRRIAHLLDQNLGMALMNLYFNKLFRCF